MSGTPSPNGGNGRDAKTGQFLPGNPGGPGNPLQKDVIRWRQLLVEHTDQDLIIKAWKEGVRKASEGDIHWFREVMNRIFGKPKERVDIKADKTLAELLAMLRPDREPLVIDG